MRRLSYHIVQRGRVFDAVRRTEWPDHDQRIYGPLRTLLGTFRTEDEARRVCLDDADWESIGASDAGRRIEINREIISRRS